MTTLLLILIMLNLLVGNRSITGQKIQLNNHPILLRLRWFGIGAVLSLYITGYLFEDDDWVTWVAILILIMGVARVPQKKSSVEVKRQQSSSTEPRVRGPVG